MPTFSETSKNRLAECDIKLQHLCNEAIKEIDFSVICGYRGREEQEKAFNDGKSKARFGKSKHNLTPSQAIDIVPSPLDWNDINSFKRLNKVIMLVANRLDIKIRWGGDFKSFKDYPHHELI